MTSTKDTERKEVAVEEKINLLGCPYCGVTPRIYEAPNHAKCMVYWVECGNYSGCEAKTFTLHCSSPKKAAAIWNRRSN